MSLTDQAEGSDANERVEKLHALIAARGPDTSFAELAEVSGLPSDKIRELVTELFLNATAQEDPYDG